MKIFRKFQIRRHRRTGCTVKIFRKFQIRRHRRKLRHLQYPDVYKGTTFIVCDCGVTWRMS